jgi:DNA-binding LytR/AlgR family response regulator
MRTSIVGSTLRERELAVTQEDIIKRYHPDWKDSGPTENEYKGYAARAMSGRPAQTTLAETLALNSDAEGSKTANGAIEACDKLRECSDDIPRLDNETSAASRLEFGLQGRSGKIAFKSRGRIVFIDSDDVVAVESQGNYVLLQRRADSYLLRESISVVAEILKPLGFVRIHRSVLVNGLFVEQIRSRPGAYGLRTKGGKEYTVTRTYKNNLKSLAAAWIGTDISF